MITYWRQPWIFSFWDMRYSESTFLFLDFFIGKEHLGPQGRVWTPSQSSSHLTSRSARPPTEWFSLACHSVSDPLSHKFMCWIQPVLFAAVIIFMMRISWRTNQWLPPHLPLMPLPILAVDTRQVLWPDHEKVFRIALLRHLREVIAADDGHVCRWPWLCSM